MANFKLPVFFKMAVKIPDNLNILYLSLSNQYEAVTASHPAKEAVPGMHTAAFL